MEIIAPLSKIQAKTLKPEKILDSLGNQIGNHDGIINLQLDKEKIKISSEKPLYVVKINANDNSIIVGSKDLLEVKKISLRGLNLLGGEKNFNDPITIKVRSTGRLLKAKLFINEKNAEVEILDKETGISPGQACVFYRKDDYGDKVLGGGWIHKTYNKNLST